MRSPVGRDGWVGWIFVTKRLCESWWANKWAPKLSCFPYLTMSTVTDQQGEGLSTNTSEPLWVLQGWLCNHVWKAFFFEKFILLYSSAFDPILYIPTFGPQMKVSSPKDLGYNSQKYRLWFPIMQFLLLKRNEIGFFTILAISHHSFWPTSCSKLTLKPLKSKYKIRSGNRT